MEKYDVRKKILLKEWSPDNVKPLDAYSPGSHATGIWTCERGHKWTAVIKSRYAGCDCPYCKGNLVIKGETDLMTVRPDIAESWDYNRNGIISPSDVKPYSNKKYWWKCGMGHSWFASPSDRCRGKGCPVCHNKAPGIDDHNLLSEHPDIANIWDYDRNIFGPEQFRPNSNKWAWFKCNKGHSWNASIHSMTRPNRPNNCPYCSGKRAINGETDVASLRPELLAEWDYEKNSLNPAEVTEFSHYKAHWICPNGHRYMATIANRSSGKGCSICNCNRIPRYI